MASSAFSPALPFQACTVNCTDKEMTNQSQLVADSFIVQTLNYGLRPRSSCERDSALAMVSSECEDDFPAWPFSERFRLVPMANRDLVLTTQQVNAKWPFTPR